MKSKLTPEIAELVGIILGDGHLHKKSNSITIVGSLEEIYYYTNHVMPLFNRVFGKIPKLRKRNDRNSYYLQLENKEVFDFLIRKVGLIRGNKVNARIPEFILKNRKAIIPFLRGLFDTDGCLKFSKQNSEINYYPRLQFTFRKTYFSREVGGILSKAGFNYCTWNEERFNGLISYQISGKDNLYRWFDIIKPSNPVHLSKFLFWREFGYYIPNSTLKKRLKALNLKTNELSF